MSTPVVMPRLGLSMEEGTIGAWLVGEGEEVEKGQPLFEVLTDKVDMEVESPGEGVLRKILAEEGEEVPVGTPIAVIAAGDEEIEAFLRELQTGETAEVEKPQKPSEAEPVERKPQSGRVRVLASPAAKRAAREAGVDLSQIEGTGPDGRITSEDVERFLSQRTGPPEPVPAAVSTSEVIPLTRVQRVAAERLSASFRDAPHIALSMDLNAEALILRRNELSERSDRVTYNDLVVQATARALRAFPRLNSMLEDDGVHLLPEINIGLAVATSEGLIVPVLRNADARTIQEIARTSTRLIEAARAGRLSPDDLSGGTFTVTNLGMYGIRWFTPVINPPQAAILGVGAIEKRPVVVDDDALRIQPMMTLTLTCDHRTVDGALGAQFLAKLREILESG